MAINAATLAASIKAALDAALGAVSGAQNTARTSLASSIATPVANAHNGDGVSSTVNVQDEGLAQGAAGTFNFVGAGVTATESYGVATITIPGGGSSTTSIDAETPSGAVNGSNVSFTLAHAPLDGSLHLYRNGLRLRPTTDFTITASTITYVAAPDTGDWHLADYRY